MPTGRLCSILRRHASVMYDVEFGLMRSILISLVDLPITRGRSILASGTLEMLLMLRNSVRWGKFPGVERLGFFCGT